MKILSLEKAAANLKHVAQIFSRKENGMKVHYKGMSSDLIKLVNDDLACVKQVIPCWLLDLVVNGPDITSNDGNHVASIAVNAHYRSANIFLGDPYFNTPDRKLILLHELCHLHTSPVMDQFRLYFKGDSIEAQAAAQWLEFSTVSLAKTFEGLIDGFK